MLATAALADAPFSDLDTLTEINTDDLLDAVGLARWGRTPLRQLFRPPARRFAHIARQFDAQVAARGLAQGSAWMLQRMTGGLDVRGAPQVPREGPLCVLANHPGMTDTVALIASLAARPDLRVIALDRPFLRALPAVARQLIFVPEGDPAGRRAAVRASVRHLQQGGALLTFPAAGIEPDPAVHGAARALAALDGWSGSFAVFARLVPQTVCLPALVSHVLDEHAQRHPLTRLRRRPQDREKLAAALQVALSRYHHGTVRVAFGPPQQLAGEEAGVEAALQQALRRELARLIEAA
jgi:1-acyl-sn-glycerol-3-phosphate acyltransferase